MPLPSWRRYPAGLDFISYDRPPSGVTPEIVPLSAPDGGKSRGVLYRRGSESTVVCIMHPRADMTRHYLAPHLVDGGYAFFAQESRWPGSDVATIHEMLVADVAAGLMFLKARGFENVVLLGNSGAASLYCLYQSQAVTSPPDRLKDTAAGDPYDINKFDMPPAQGMIFLGAHLGPGKILMTEIDPSVVHERDPLSCNPDLDMFNPRNGFREPPEESAFSEQFVHRYRAAQIERVSRIDGIARDLIARQRAFLRLSEQSFVANSTFDQRTAIIRSGAQGHYLQISRLEANPAFVDLSIQPSARSYGALMSTRPDISNFGEAAVKILTPRAWLSSWSGHSSRASVVDSLPKVDVPTLVLNYSGDSAIHPYHSRTIYENSPASDKAKAEVNGDHFGLDPVTRTDKGARAEAAGIMIEWLQRRFPSRNRTTG